MFSHRARRRTVVAMASAVVASGVAVTGPVGATDSTAYPTATNVGQTMPTDEDHTHGHEHIHDTSATATLMNRADRPLGPGLTSPSWIGTSTLNAGWGYSWGGVHRAWDVGLKLGTPLYAPRKSTVIGLNDGVPNNPGGVNPGPNSPSNWVLLCSVVKGKEISSLWQHLSPGIPVQVGQTLVGPKVASDGTVRAGTGTQFAFSGNTGNSTGPHLHLATMTGCAAPAGPGNNTPAALSRYNYLDKPETLVWEPSKLWRRPVVDSAALLTAYRARSKSPAVAAFRKAVGSGTSSGKINASFTSLITDLKASINFKNRSGKPTKEFLKKLAKRTEDFAVR